MNLVGNRSMIMIKGLKDGLQEFLDRSIVTTEDDTDREDSNEEEGEERSSVAHDVSSSENEAVNEVEKEEKAKDGKDREQKIKNVRKAAEKKAPVEVKTKRSKKKEDVKTGNHLSDEDKKAITEKKELAKERRKENIKSKQGKLNDDAFNLNDNESLDRHYNEAVLKRPGSPNVSDKPDAPAAPEKQKSKNCYDLKDRM